MQNQFDMVPQSLKSLPNWVLWKLEIRDGKETKVPYQINGHKASTADSGTWSTFENVLRQMADGGYSGIGFVFNQAFDFCGIDIDNCRDPQTGIINDKALKIIEQLDSYTEASPSGTGIHVLVQGAWPYNRNRKDELEVYNHGRYFTVTGQIISKTNNVHLRPKQLEWLYKTYLHSNGNGHKEPISGLNQEPAHSDEWVISNCRKARNSSKFEKLYDYGDISEYGDDDSRADSALCCLFAFWTRDYAQVDRLLRGSKLYRQKWEREDYRQRTIERAFEVVTDWHGREQETRTEAVKEFQEEKAQETSNQFQGFKVGDWVEQPEEPIDDIITDMFEKGDKIAVIGRSKSKKSFFIQQMGFCVAAGRSFLGWQVLKPRKVLLIQYEIKGKRFHSRCVKMAKRLEFSRAELNNLTIINGRGHEFPLKLIEENVKLYEPELVIVDPLYKLMEGDESKIEVLKPIYKFFDHICETYGCAFLYLHHDKKGLTGKEDTVDRGAGSGITARDYDTGIVLSPDEDPDSLTMEFEFRNNPPKEISKIQFLNGCFVNSDDVPRKKTQNSKAPSIKLPQLLKIARKVLKEEYLAGRHSLEIQTFNCKMTDSGIGARKLTAVKEELEQMGFITFQTKKAQKGKSSITVFILDTVLEENKTMFNEFDGF